MRSLWPTGGLWRHRDFLRLWAAQVVSAMGSRITRTALPVLAVITLGGSPTEVALVSALSFGPGALVGLFAGGWVDRSAKRPLLVGCDLVRAAAVMTLPLAAWHGRLTIVQVAAVAVVVGAATALFQIADVAFLPAVIRKSDLVEGNSKLQSTEAVAEIVGPGLGGALIQVLGAPLAVLLDALSYLWSAAWLRGIRADETKAAEAELGTISWRDDVRTGFSTAWNDPHVRPLLLATVAINLFGGFFLALYSLYLLRDLGLSTATLGAIIGCGGIGALGGAAIGGRLVGRVGLGRLLVGSLVAHAAASALIPMAGEAWVPAEARVPLLVTHQLLGDGCLMVFTIFATSVRQSVVPGARLGRVNAAFQVAQGTLMPIVALAAGPAAARFGTGTVVWGATLCAALAPLAVAGSPVASLASLPAGPAES